MPPFPTTSFTPAFSITSASNASILALVVGPMGINYISALHLYYSAEEVYKYVAEYGVFASFTDVGEYLKFLKTIYDKGEAHLSRYVSLLAGGLVFNSPYFPASITTRRGISLSLLYPNDIKTLSDIEEALKRGEQLGMRPATKKSRGCSCVRTLSFTSAMSKYVEISLTSVGAVRREKNIVPKLALIDGSMSPTILWLAKTTERPHFLPSLTVVSMTSLESVHVCGA